MVDAPTLVGRLQAHAEARPRAVALRHKQLGRWTEIDWATYRDEVAAFAHALHASGLAEGDAVAILSDNRPEWLYADLGAQSIGALAVGIYQTNPAPDVAYILRHAGVRVLVCEDQEQVDKAIEVADDTPTVERVVCIDPRGTRGYPDPRLVPWHDFVAEGSRRHDADPGWWGDRVAERDGDAPSMVVYTSGTTGRPKGALLSPRNATAVVGTLAESLGATDADWLLSYLPLCHVAEKIYSVFLPLSVGCVVHFGESIATVQEDLREVSPTIFLGVPRIWEKMHASVTLRMQDSGWLQRRLFDHFVGRGMRWREPDRTRPLGVLERAHAWLADVLVFRALQEHLAFGAADCPRAAPRPSPRSSCAGSPPSASPCARGTG